MSLNELNFDTLNQLIADKNAAGLKAFIETHELEVKDGKIFPKDKEAVKKLVAFWDKRQLVKKINLNSLYGAILNPHCRFADKRIGQSTTLSGRSIAKHMAGYINECILGVKDHLGDSIIYGDSVTGDTIIRTSEGDITIAKLYDQCLEHSVVGEKEYGVWNETKVLGFNGEYMAPVTASINCVMRHKTKKKLYRITTENGKQVTVTEDHSIMVDRDGFLIECKPTELLENDLVITLVT